MKRNDLDFVADYLDRHLVSTLILVVGLIFVIAIALSGCAAVPGDPCAGSFFCIN